MNNTTILISQENLTNNYDTIGAIIFIIVVLLWYSLSIIFLLGMQTIKPTETIENSVQHSRNLFNHNFCEKTNNKKILEELGNKEKRDKLWNIYLGRSGQMTDEINRAETLRIRHIQRQLIMINNSHRDDHENIRLSVPNISSSDNYLRVRRQSSMNQQILEDWKTTVDSFKVRENWPWTIQKLIIQRRLKRQRQVKDYEPLRKQSLP